MAASTWEKMWRYVRQVHPDGEQVERAIRGQQQQKVISHNLEYHIIHVHILLPRWPILSSQ